MRMREEPSALGSQIAFGSIRLRYYKRVPPPAGMQHLPAFLFLSLLLSIFSHGAAQPQFSATIAGLTAVTDSAAVAPFDSSAAPLDLTYNATNVSVTITATTALSYQIFLSASGGITQPADWRSGTLAAGSSASLLFGAHLCSCGRLTCVDRAVASFCSLVLRCSFPWCGTSFACLYAPYSPLLRLPVTRVVSLTLCLLPIYTVCDPFASV